MSIKEEQLKYAKVILGAVVALQQWQLVELNCPVDLADFAAILT